MYLQHKLFYISMLTTLCAIIVIKTYDCNNKLSINTRSVPILPKK